MRFLSLPSIGALGAFFLLSGCLAADVTESPEEEIPAFPEETDPEEVTHNVSYQGTVEEAGMTISMQGTHKLVLADGRSVLLESAVYDLTTLVGEEVEVRGDVRPTVEEGGTIMDVKSVTMLSTSSSEASSEALSSAEASSSIAASVAASAVAASSISRAVSSQAAAVSSAMAVSSVAASEVPSSGLEARTQLMAKDDLSPSRWTQQYCTSHIGMCLPVHKNWYFNSFGTTTSFLWHVEVNSEEIESLGDGPISVNLVAGALTEADRSVSVSGGEAVGYREWNTTSHFEVRGPASLQAAIRYITENLSKYE